MRIDLQFAAAIVQQHRERIGFLAGGTARNPDTNRALARHRREQLVQHRCGQKGEGVGIAEKRGDADQEIAEESIALLFALLDQVGVFLDIARLNELHPALDASGDGIDLVIDNGATELVVTGVTDGTDLATKLNAVYPGTDFAYAAGPPETLTASGDFVSLATSTFITLQEYHAYKGYGE